MRRFSALLLLAALFWQALAPAGPAGVVDTVQRWLHEDLHAMQVQHHHHEDGSVHHEEGGGTNHHAHPAFDLNPALLANDWKSTKLPSTRAESDRPGPRYAGPVLAGLLRPPQAG